MVPPSSRQGQRRRRGSSRRGLYERPRRPRPDYRAAVYWLDRAASKGDSYAQLNLGALYADGKGVPRDMQRARSLFVKATLSSDQRVAHKANENLSAMLHGSPPARDRDDQTAAVVGVALVGLALLAVFSGSGESVGRRHVDEHRAMLRRLPFDVAGTADTEHAADAPTRAWAHDREHRQNSDGRHHENAGRCREITVAAGLSLELIEQRCRVHDLRGHTEAVPQVRNDRPERRHSRSSVIGRDCRQRTSADGRVKLDVRFPAVSSPDPLSSVDPLLSFVRWPRMTVMQRRAAVRQEDQPLTHRPRTCPPQKCRPTQRCVPR